MASPPLRAGADLPRCFVVDPSDARAGSGGDAALAFGGAQGKRWDFAQVGSERERAGLGGGCRAGCVGILGELLDHLRGGGIGVVLGVVLLDPPPERLQVA